MNKENCSAPSGSKGDVNPKCLDNSRLFFFCRAFCKDFEVPLNLSRFGPFTQKIDEDQNGLGQHQRQTS